MGGKLYCKTQKLYCNRQLGLVGSCIAIQQIVLQGCVVGWEENCIAIHFLYCSLVGMNLCCNTRDCIAIEWAVGWEEGRVTIQNLYCD